MGLALYVATAPGSSQLLQVAFAAVLGGGGLAAVTAWRKAKPEAELTVVQGMKVALEEVRKERDEARALRDEWQAKYEATKAHSIFMQRRVAALEARLRFAHIDLPDTPSRDPESAGRRHDDHDDLS